MFPSADTQQHEAVPRALGGRACATQLCPNAFDPRWLARLEYRYYDFGSFNTSNVGAYLPLHLHTTVNTVRAGFAYLFNAPAPVVVTKD